MFVKEDTYEIDFGLRYYNKPFESSHQVCRWLSKIIKSYKS